MTPTLNMAWARAIMDVLAANGVERVVVSPGSRSTPLAVAAQAHPLLQIHVLTDERAAAFLALGLARGAGRPVALVCTSGTAAAHYHPAMIEARQSHVPLIALTADRPARLRHLGAPQTIEQPGLFGAAALKAIELPPAEAGALRQMAAQLALLVGVAVGERGPVHLNVPFDEPLAPVPGAEAPALEAPPRVVPGLRLAADSALLEIAERLAAAERPLVVAGPTAGALGAGPALLDWAAAAGVPVVADVGADLRGLESQAAVLCHADVWLRDEALQPDLILRVGGAMTARGVLDALARRPRAVALQPDGDGRDHEAICDLVATGAVAEAFGRLPRPAEPGHGAWRRRLVAAETAIAGAIASPATPVPQEARALAEAAAALPPGGVLSLSNSLPIRHADTYMGRGPRGVRTVVHRGANGIDGLTAMSVGVAVATGAPTLLVTGDLAFLHDLGGLSAARELSSPLVVLVLNNDGGGIFSYLPVAGATPHFEALFGTPHGVALSGAAELFGLPHQLVGLDGVRGAVEAGLRRPGLSVVEFQSDRAATAADHKACLAALAGAIAVVAV